MAAGSDQLPPLGQSLRRMEHMLQAVAGMDRVVGGGFEDVQNAVGVVVLEVEPFGVGADRVLFGFGVQNAAGEVLAGEVQTVQGGEVNLLGRV